MARPGLTRHRKFLRLSRKVGGIALALGSLELVWNAAYEAGDDLLGDADDVEQLAAWQGAPGVLAEALLDCGFLDLTDAGLIVHDLWHHAPDYVQKRRRREAERRAKRDPVRSVSGQCPVNGEQLPVARPEVTVTPAPAPAPAPVIRHNTHPYPPSGEGGNPEPSVSIFDGLQVPDDAALAQDAVEAALRNAGWEVEREVYVDDRGDGQRGRIDLIARKGGRRVAIEVDRVTPRSKSVQKLREMPKGVERVVLLRAAHGPQSKIEGIDCVLGIGSPGLRPVLAPRKSGGQGSMSIPELEAEIDAIRHRAGPDAVMGADRKRLDDLRSELGRRTAAPAASGGKA